MKLADKERIWVDMRERLMKLTMKQLKQIAKDEQISLGYYGYRKDSLVGRIVSERRHRTLLSGDDPSTHPWRRWGSVNAMPVKHVGYE